MKAISTILFVGCILICCHSAFAQHRSVKFSEAKWDDILIQAKKEHKIIFLDCYTAWCAPCKWMAANVFTNDSVADFYNANFINVGRDMEKGEGIVLAKNFVINSYPTMLYIDEDGNQIHRTSGKVLPNVFIENGKDALKPEKLLSSWAKKFNDDPSNGPLAFAYFEMLQKASQPHNSEVEKYLSTQKESDLTSPINWKIMYSHLYNNTSKMPENNSLKAFRYLEANKSAFEALYTIDSVETVINNVYNFELYFATKSKDKREFELLKTNFRKTATKASEQIILYADLHYYQIIEDWNNYAITAVAYIDKYASKKALELANDAYVFYEHVDDKELLLKAETWAKKAVELRGNSKFYEVYASVLYKLGKKTEAKAAAENAISLAQKEGEEYGDAEKLLKKINELNIH